jgi:hypothetical protein
MKAYPEFRGAQPKKSAFWLVEWIPQVQIWAREVHIGFNKSGSREWAPVMQRPMLRINRFGIDVLR